MDDFTPREVQEARRDLLSLRSKSAKASGKLKEGSWQKMQMDAYVSAADTALRLMDGDAGLLEPERLWYVHKSLEDALHRAEEAIGKFAPGSSQHTLQQNRIAALRIALCFIEKAQSQSLT
jgi:hypothetical protein